MFALKKVVIWGSTYPSNLHCIVLLQKRIIRIVCKAAYDANTEPIFKEFGLFPLASRALAVF